MIRHNIKLAFRNFQKDKSTFLINLIGLSTGLACTIVILMWVTDELNVDKFHTNDQQLFRIYSNFDENGEITTEEGLPPLLSKTMEEKIPEIKLGASASGTFSFSSFSSNDTYLDATGKYVTDNFFQLFSFEMIEGNEKKLFPNKNGIVISESLAKKFYGSSENVLGKVISYESRGETVQTVVSGVFKDVPQNSTMQFDYLLSFDRLIEYVGQKHIWQNYISETYVLTHKEVALNDFNKKIEGFLMAQNGSDDDFLWAQQYTLFILLIACINFMNLSTANATKKFKEVGVKKTIGADRQTLIIQYLGESMMLSFFALLIAFVMIYFFLPNFNLITGKELSLKLSPIALSSIFGITLLTGLISGSYPAFYLSSFKPAKIFKGNIKNSWGELWARKGLVIFQFAVSIILIVSVMVIYQQIEFIQNKKLGFNKDNVVHFKFTDTEARVKIQILPQLCIMFVSITTLWKC